MVLYKSSKGVAKTEKAKWVMHQYHIGPGEDELEGQLVVSKVFYQQVQSTARSENEYCSSTAEGGVRVDPRTPSMSTPQPPRLAMDSPREDDGNRLQFLRDHKEEGEGRNRSNLYEPSRPHEFLIESAPQTEYAFNSEVNGNARGFSDLDDIKVDTPPDFQLAVRDICWFSRLLNDLKSGDASCLWLAGNAGLAIWFPREHDELAGAVLA